MSNITLPDFLFPAIVHNGLTPCLVTILVYDREHTIFSAWFHNEKDQLTISVYQTIREGVKKWIELRSDSETELSRAIGLAIENNYYSH